MPKAKAKASIAYPKHTEQAAKFEEALTSVLPKPKRDTKGRVECPLMNHGAGGWRGPAASLGRLSATHRERLRR